MLGRAKYDTLDTRTDRTHVKRKVENLRTDRYLARNLINDLLLLPLNLY